MQMNNVSARATGNGGNARQAFDSVCAQAAGETPVMKHDALFERFSVRRLYADPPRWETDVDRWALRHGERHVIQWPTYRTKQMHDALDRFVTDLNAGRITHDGCPLTALCLGNARKVAKTSDRYILGKPSQSQKIDAAMATVLAHEAAADERAAGWPDQTDRRMFVFR